MLNCPISANDESFGTLLSLAQAGRLPHAILLEGPRGSGRYTLAKSIAAMALCTHSPPGCGACRECSQALREQHPDVEVFAQDGPSGSLTIKSLRTINEGVAVPPNQGRRRVIILRDIQDTAQVRTLNTLLKVIEEPPDYLMFIITVDSRENALPTVVSRCLCLHMRLPDTAACAKAAAALLPEGEVPPQKLARMARLSGGVVGRTAALCSDTPQAKAMQSATAVCEAIAAGDCYSALRTLSAYERDRAGYRELLGCLRVALSQAVLDGYLPPESDVSVIGTPLSPTRGMAALGAVERLAASARYNVNLPLALSYLGARLFYTD